VLFSASGTRWSEMNTFKGSIPEDGRESPEEAVVTRMNPRKQHRQKHMHPIKSSYT